MAKHTYQTETDEPAGPEGEPRKRTRRNKRKKKNGNGILKMLAVSAAGAIAGATAVRAWDKHVLGRGEPQPPQAPQPPVQNPVMPAFGMPMMPMVAAMPAMQAPAPAPAPVRNPVDDVPDLPSSADVALAIEEGWAAEEWD